MTDPLPGNRQENVIYQDLPPRFRGRPNKRVGRERGEGLAVEALTHSLPVLVSENKSVPLFSKPATIHTPPGGRLAELG
jgi:hypothetical protein